MSNITISIFGNKIFSEILTELELFSRYKIMFFKDYEEFKKCNTVTQQLLIFFVTENYKKDFFDLNKINFPLILIDCYSKKFNTITNNSIEKLTTPFKILSFEKKIISTLAKYKFVKSSLINLHNYTIDKNERKIKRNNQELQLTEKEIDFLILFSNANQPLSRKEVLKKVWSYSPETETHTVETHIHRLRKKIFDKFGDNNFIKNSNKGYYI